MCKYINGMFEFQLPNLHKLVKNEDFLKNRKYTDDK